MADFTISLDLYPGRDIKKHIENVKSGSFGRITAKDMLCSILKEPLSEYIAKSCHEDISLIPELVHGLEFRPTSLRGWKDAQVTSGGVSLDEIDDASSESKIVPGLYITGELADRDYPCGGFNLSNAWLTGLAAADDISE